MVKALKIALTLLVGLVTLPTLAQAREWQLTGDQNTVTYTGQAMGASFTGHFKDFTAEVLEFDPESLQGWVKVSVAIASADSENSQRDGLMQSEAFFDSATYPSGFFEANTFKHVEGNRYTAEGFLKLKDVVQPVAITFNWAPDASGQTAKVSGGLTLNRMDYKLGTGLWAPATVVGHEVEVAFDFAVKAP